MSFNSKQEATKAGKELLGKIKYPGFKVRVHENIGWHASAGNEIVNVHISNYSVSGIQYWGLLETHYSHYEYDGNGEGLKKAQGTDPNKVIKAAFEMVDNFTQKQVEFRDRFKAALELDK